MVINDVTIVVKVTVKCPLELGFPVFLVVYPPCPFPGALVVLAVMTTIEILIQFVFYNILIII